MRPLLEQVVLERGICRHRLCNHMTLLSWISEAMIQKLEEDLENSNIRAIGFVLKFRIRAGLLD